MSLNRLRSIFEAEKADIRERERYFGTMLDHVQSGVIVIDGEKIDYSNTVAKGFLGMAEISSLRQIARISPDLANAFREASEMESRASDMAAGSAIGSQNTGTPSRRCPAHLT